jgi:hypothetical protein
MYHLLGATMVDAFVFIFESTSTIQVSSSFKDLDFRSDEIPVF